jgi:beta-mannosidase
MRSINLDGKWQIQGRTLACTGEKGLARVRRAETGWMDARVPGEVHLDLKRAGLMPEPLVSTNAHRCRWPEKKSWWYRRLFNVSAAFLKEERQLLVFDGIDLYGQVFVNGRLVGEAKNAFVPLEFDVRTCLQKGRNELIVRVTAGSELAPGYPDERLLARPKDPWSNKAPWAGRQWLRKPQFTYGWDWVDALPNIGIWRSVHLEGRSGVLLQDIRLDTALHDRDVYIEGEAVIENLHPWSSCTCRLNVELTAPDGRTIVYAEEVRAQVGRQAVHWWMPVPDAQLWWPNGMGDQPLYAVRAWVEMRGATSDERRFNIGLRTVEIDQSPIRAGRRFCIKVNGQDVFCRGGNWIPADALLARVDRGKIEALVGAAREANMTMLRIWGGGIYEADAFYDACDRAGILVWQDFLFACSEYPDDEPWFREMIRWEAECAVRRLRHHACIALWSGNNENVLGFTDWWYAGKQGTEPGLRLGGTRLYNQVLPDVCRHLDANRPYWPSSPCGGVSPNAETEGDCHWWMEAMMNPDVNRRIQHEVYDECQSRFISEYGAIGPCHLDSMKQYLAPGEMRLSSAAFKAHTNAYEKETTPAAIRRHYAEPESLSLEDYVLYGQMFQAMMYGLSIESMRFRKHDPAQDCAGALIWMYNDCWGETGWTPIDYYLRRKASYYWIKRACAPVKPLVRRRGGNLVLRVVNDTLADATGVLKYGWFRFDGAATDVQEAEVVVPANGIVEIGRQAIGKRDAADWCFAAILDRGAGGQTSALYCLLPQRELRIPESDIRCTVNRGRVRLISHTYCHGVHIEDRGRGAWSDNFFDLLPGVPHILERTDGRVVDRAPKVRIVKAVPANGRA